MAKTRNQCFTLTNWTEEELQDIRAWEVKYLIIGKEICPTTGTPHLQGYVEFKNPRTLTALKKLNRRIHWEPREASAIQASDYCKKDGNFETYGTISKQGERNDLVELKEEIVNGRSVDDIVMETPMYFHQYGRTLERIEAIVNRKKFRTYMTEGYWYFGESGVGKSYKAYQQHGKYNPDTHYNRCKDNGWWDGYRGQEICIIDEFRGDLPYSELLDLVDIKPHSVKRRNGEPIPFLSKKVIVTSSMPPEEVYCNLSKRDSLKQLYRRFKVYEVLGNGEMVEYTWDGTDGTEVVRGNTIVPSPLPLDKNDPRISSKEMS